MRALLEIDGLSIALDNRGVTSRPLVEDLSFSIGAGELFAIVGESGSGKTLTARSIPGLLPPQIRVVQGEIKFDGNDLTSLPTPALRALRGREIGMIFQEPMTSLNPSLTIGRQITEGMILHERLTKKEAKARALEMLAKVQIPDAPSVFRSYPHQLSGGMRQRVMIASALVMHPRLLIADEPTTALDALVRREVMELMIGLARDSGAAILLISHDLAMVAEHAARLVVLQHGKAVESGTPHEILLHPRHDYTRSLLNAMPARDDRLLGPKVSPLLEMEELDVRFRRPGRLLARRATNVHAVRHANLTLMRGETLAVVGESGSGKTSIGRTILGLHHASAGQIRFDGELLDSAGSSRSQNFRNRTAMIFQDPGSSLNPRMSLRDIVAESLRHRPGLDAKERLDRAEAALEEVRLPAAYGSRFPHELSGGQRQRVAIARAIVAEPDLVIADEPVSALDPSVQHQVLKLFRSLQERHGFSSLFISHDLGVVEQIADRVAVMLRGRLIELGSRDDIFDRPAHPYTRRLIEASPRIVPSGSDSFQLVSADCSDRVPPEGLRWFGEGQAGIEGVASPLMVEIDPGHWAMCSNA